MTTEVLLVDSDHPQQRTLENFLAPRRPLVRPFPKNPEDLPWETESPGEASDVLVVSGFDRTEATVILVRTALEEEPDLSVMVADDPSHWPEVLTLLPGVVVDDLTSRARFEARIDRLLERRMLLRLAEDGSGMPQDRLAQAILVSEVPAVREMALLLQRVEEQAGHIVYAGERGCLRTRVLRHLLTKGGTQPLAEDGSVLLIDDIDDRSVSEQGEILRLAQQGRRVLATASDRFLDRVKDGSFRRDLYYALGGQPVVAVSLKDRLEDIPTLLEACVVAWGDDRVLDALREYDWPGNLRELELVSEHAALLAKHEPIRLHHLVLPGPAVEDMLSKTFMLRVPPEGVAFDRVEEELLRQTLEATRSNVAEAARRLNVGREKLRYRLRRLGLGK